LESLGKPDLCNVFFEKFAYIIPEIRLSYGFDAIACVRNMETGGFVFE
jgi:hypothetical protein